MDRFFIGDQADFATLGIDAVLACFPAQPGVGFREKQLVISDTF